VTSMFIELDSKEIEKFLQNLADAIYYELIPYVEACIPRVREWIAIVGKRWINWPNSINKDEALIQFLIFKYDLSLSFGLGLALVINYVDENTEG